MFSSQASAASCPTPGNVTELLEAAGPALENARRRGGGSGISRNAKLDEAAQNQACYVARRGYSSRNPHRGAGGSTVKTRVKKTGYKTCMTAENLALGHSSADMVVQEWMSSPGHRSNMVLRGVKEYGLGLAMAGDRPVWIMVLAKPC